MADDTYKLPPEYEVKVGKTVAKPPKLKPINVSTRESMATVVPGSHQMARRCFNPWFIRKHWKIPPSKQKKPRFEETDEVEVTFFQGTNKEHVRSVKRHDQKNDKAVNLGERDGFRYVLLPPTEQLDEWIILKLHPRWPVEASRGYKSSYEAQYTWLEGRAKFERVPA